MDPLVLTDDVVRRALASDLARELLLSPHSLRPLLKEIVLEVVVHYEAVARVERCKRVLDLFRQEGFSLYVNREGRLCYSNGKLSASLKAVFDVHGLELKDYLADKQKIAGAAENLRAELEPRTDRNGHANR